MLVLRFPIRRLYLQICCRIALTAGQGASADDLETIKYIIEHSGVSAAAVKPAVEAVAPLLRSSDAQAVLMALDCVDGLSSAPASAFTPIVPILIDPVVACAGHSRSSVRERAVDVLLALMDVAGPSEVFELVRKIRPARSRNGSLRE